MNETLERPRTASTVSVVSYDKRWLPQVLMLARELHDESIFHRDIELDEEKLAVQFERAGTFPDYYFKLAVRGDEVLGGFFGHISSVFFSKEQVAKDISWFVTRERRGSVAAVALVRDFEAWARAKGVKHFILGQSTGVNMDTTKALYEHLGYEVIGFNTRKRIA
jgi:GNAT superfamily N-acetyltransferase